MTIEQILIIAHVIGTVIGVGAATMVEAHLARASRDGTVTPDERAILGIDYTMMRVGLVILLLSGFGFLILDKFEGQTQYLYSPRLWAKLTFVIVIAVNTLLLQARMISLYWGTALSFVSWWGAALVGMFVTHGVRFDLFGDGAFITVFLSLLFPYVLLIVFGAAILHRVRIWRTA